MLNAGLSAPAHFCEPGKLRTGRFGSSSVQGSQEKSSMSALHLSTKEIYLFSKVVSAIKDQFGGGPKMMILVVELFVFGVPGTISGTSAMRRITSLVLCSDLAQNHVSKCRHSASCVTYLYVFQEHLQ